MIGERGMRRAKHGDSAASESVDRAVAAIANGEIAIVVDDDDRENEGDLVMAASMATPEKIAFVIRHSSGILCTPLSTTRARHLCLQPMVADNDAPLGTAFTVSVDYREGMTTGISALERAATIRALASDASKSTDFVRPGHVFPLLAMEGGVLFRAGHTEAAVDFLRLAGVPEIGVVAELVNDDGTVMRLPELRKFAETFGMPMVSIADLISYRLSRESLIARVARFRVDTEIGVATAYAYKSPFADVENLALVFGDLEPGVPTPVYIHRESVIADVLAAGVPTAGSQISEALEYFRAAGKGVLIYLRDGPLHRPDNAIENIADRRASLERSRIRAWMRKGVAVNILRELGITSAVLLTNRGSNVQLFEGVGIHITEIDLISSRSSTAKVISLANIG
jgi:3,4-dihydroxy 2-butanone 4-phosphate synthase/GTP cyclohydrolase II